jgi:hypothetical protein
MGQVHVGTCLRRQQQQGCGPKHGFEHAAVLLSLLMVRQCYCWIVCSSLCTSLGVSGTVYMVKTMFPFWVTDPLNCQARDHVFNELLGVCAMRVCKHAAACYSQFAVCKFPAVKVGNGD